MYDKPKDSACFLMNFKQGSVKRGSRDVTEVRFQRSQLFTVIDVWMHGRNSQILSKDFDFFVIFIVSCHFLTKQGTFPQNFHFFLWQTVRETRIASKTIFRSTTIETVVNRRVDERKLTSVSESQMFYSALLIFHCLCLYKSHRKTERIC